MCYDPCDHCNLPCCYGCKWAEEDKAENENEKEVNANE